MSTGWSVYVIALIVLNIAGCAWLLLANRSVQIDPREKGQSTGHDFDGIEELNNPLPAWWTWLFVMTIVFAVIYFILYPGFGNFPGVLGWTSAGQHEAEVARAEAAYGPIFARYFKTPIPELLDDERAIDMGGRIFAQRCSTCHGSDARGGRNYPNLTDDDWLYGGDPETIVKTITYGRNGMMPPFAAVIGGDEGVKDVTEYVLSLSGREHDAERAERGRQTFVTVCSACHMPTGTGNQAIGSPNLTDDIWLHGGRREDIERALKNGITSQMPAHVDMYTPEQIHLVAAYVYSLSAKKHGGG
ncbi:MAG TPA: cytochrome-c oxidase, cbb3-type subunit III [Deltaproteobacteria bacterium]|nr:cytochrome-c oxidase, cbb3-type subunit III [Deltaproteobacteria bacterium]